MKIYFVKLTNLVKNFMIVLSIAGCHNYYMESPVDKNGDMAKTIDGLKQQKKYFILRNGNYSYSIQNIFINNDTKSLEIILDTMSPVHLMNINKDRNGKMIYKKNNPRDLKVLTEAHIYIIPDKTITTGPHALKFSDIEKIELIKRDKRKTRESSVIAGLITLASLALITGVIISASYEPL